MCVIVGTEQPQIPNWGEKQPTWVFSTTGALSTGSLYSLGLTRNLTFDATRRCIHISTLSLGSR